MIASGAQRNSSAGQRAGPDSARRGPGTNTGSTSSARDEILRHKSRARSSHVAVLGLFTLFYTGVTAAIVAGFRRFLARQPKPLSATLEELAEDEACIRGKN